MLQQTRVDTVIPYFNRFMEQFPTVKDLALADEEKVMKAWEGLGYYSRVRNLQAAVKEVYESYGGVVPDTKEQFSKLKGVGPYTSGAVLSIAYNKPYPAVDGNVMRVISVSCPYGMILQNQNETFSNLRLISSFPGKSRQNSIKG